MTTDYIKFKKLTAHEGEAIEAILGRVVEALRGLNQEATLQIQVSRVSGEHGQATHTISLAPSGASLKTGAIAGTKPTLIAILDSETFYGIAGATYSPVQAYLDGKLTLLGDVAVGKSIAKKLTGSGTILDVCP